MRRSKDTEMLRMRQVRVAVCGELPTACAHLSRVGVIHMDHYTDAVNLRGEEHYDLILVHAPAGEGLLDTYYIFGEERIPVRLLREPCCHSALLELSMTLAGIARTRRAEDGETRAEG